MAALSCLSLPHLARSAEIILPPSPSAEELQAASELARVWRLATGESPGPSSRNVRFYLGDTPFARAEAPLPLDSGPDGFRVLARPDGTVILHGATPLASVFAANWFCARELKARWFFPGELGEIVPSGTWAPHPLDVFTQPAFLSRAIGLDASSQSWALRNNLHERWPHGHALLRVIPRSLFGAHPDWFPLLEGQRYRPVDDGDFHWQPNLADPAVALEASRYVRAHFLSHPEAEAVSLSINDSARFDQSPETLALRGPLRWFRGRPDYSDLVFGFMNRVADATAKAVPGKLLSAYAYYWCEDTPSFRISPSILPWLTADRTQWYDRSFAREDQALILRWCRSGASTVGCYDYLYGAPFLIPRVTPHLTAESIRFEFASGVRAFTAEATPHWAFDAPKLWVLTQLLWDPGRSTDSLLDECYQSLFHGAAPAMRQFYSLCESTWNAQPGPARWIKYYQDPAQAALFPSNVRRLLRASLENAASAARDPLAVRRVAFVRTAYDAADAFCSFCEARNALKTSPTPVLEADYLEKRARFTSAYARAVAAGAMASTDLSVYLRDDPAANMAADSAALHWLQAPMPDPALSNLATPASLDDTTFVWNKGPWYGRGEPSPRRTIRIITLPDGSRAIRYEHAAYDHLSQWITASPGALYRARALFRGRVGPGSEAYLIVSFLDRDGHYVGDDGRGSAARRRMAHPPPPRGHPPRPHRGGPIRLRPLRLPSARVGLRGIQPSLALDRRPSPPLNRRFAWRNPPELSGLCRGLRVALRAVAAAVDHDDQGQQKQGRCAPEVARRGQMDDRDSEKPLNNSENNGQYADH